MREELVSLNDRTNPRAFEVVGDHPIRLFPAITYQGSLLHRIAAFDRFGIFEAIEFNSQPLLKRIINDNVSLIEMGRHPWNSSSPIEWAVTHGSLGALKIMYEAAPHVLHQNKKLAFLAAEKGFLSIVEFIYEKDPSQLLYSKSAGYGKPDKNVIVLIWSKGWTLFLNRLIDDEALMINDIFIDYLKFFGKFELLDRLAEKFPQHAAKFQCNVYHRLNVEAYRGNDEVARQMILDNPNFLLSGSNLNSYLPNFNVSNITGCHSVLELMAKKGWGDLFLKIIGQNPSFVELNVIENDLPHLHIRTTRSLPIEWIKAHGDLSVIEELIKKYPAIANHYIEEKHVQRKGCSHPEYHYSLAAVLICYGDDDVNLTKK